MTTLAILCFILVTFTLGYTLGWKLFLKAFSALDSYLHGRTSNE
jgi:hypothetical protein